MNTAIAACASSGVDGNWHQINWSQVNRLVRRLQIRIVKAIQVNRYGKAKALQWLLTHSFSGKALAVRRVTENQGKRTSGVDREVWSTPQSKANAISTLKRYGYKPKPLRRIYIPKSNGRKEKRPLDIPTMKDRGMQALHKLALEPIAETTADGNSYGFRPKRSTRDAIAHCFILLGKKTSAPWVLEGDIKGCFNQISHQWLIDHIPMDKGILTKWLKAGYVYGNELFPTESGTPQGGIASPTLANMTLDGLEKELKTSFSRVDREDRANKVRFCRYADDFIVTGTSKELLENEVKPVIEDFLWQRDLILSEEKTKITHIDEGFDFLGVNIRKYNGKLLIKPSKANVKAFLKKIRGVVKSNKTLQQGKLIRLLNPMIRGWANYHQPWVSSKTFKTVDHQIFKVLWQWSKRRHTNKGVKWVKKRYFKSIKIRHWMFSEKDLNLFYTEDVEIKRYAKIKSEANPFCLEWEIYFENKLSQKMANDVTFSSRLRSLWKHQQGRCLQCKTFITKESGWNIHHLIARVEGGRDTVSNLVLLHPNCHIQVHNQKLKVVKPLSNREFRKT